MWFLLLQNMKTSEKSVSFAQLFQKFCYFVIIWLSLVIFFTKLQNFWKKCTSWNYTFQKFCRSVSKILLYSYKITKLLKNLTSPSIQSRSFVKMHQKYFFMFTKLHVDSLPPQKWPYWIFWSRKMRNVLKPIQQNFNFKFLRLGDFSTKKFNEKYSFAPISIQTRICIRSRKFKENENNIFSAYENV